MNSFDVHLVVGGPVGVGSMGKDYADLPWVPGTSYGMVGVAVSGPISCL